MTITIDQPVTILLDIEPHTVTQEEAAALDAFRLRLVEAIEQKGADYVYPNLDHCDYLTYTEGHYMETDHCTGPSCIVGHVLVADGFTVPQIVAWEGTIAESVIKDLYSDSFELLAVAARAAQSAQDGGKTWGQALQAYDQAIADAFAGVVA